MLSPWDKLVTSRFARNRRERRLFVRIARDAARKSADGESVTYRRVRGARLNIGQVILVSAHRDPRILMLVAGALLLYSAAILFAVFKHSL